MFITLHCGGLPFNGEKFNELSIGGSESAAYYVARELAAQGHKVTVFTNEKEGCVHEDVRYHWMGNVTRDFPLGEDFHYYASQTPTDVLIIQRHTQAFNFKWASKINLWWVHDLGLIRNAPQVESGLSNIDGVLCVSEFHKEQLASVWNIDPDIIVNIKNGVDLSLFEGDVERSEKPFKMLNQSIGPRLLYSSRPERGLENLVKPDGIMERLLNINPNCHLYVTMYNNAPKHIMPYYRMLWSRIEELPNCTNLGTLNKQELADTMRQCNAMVYPTDFEEVSCITAMECMAAGLPFISSHFAALPETCKDSGSVLIPLKDGEVDIDAFIDRIVCRSDVWGATLKAQQLKAAKKYEWKHSAQRLLNHVSDVFTENMSNPGTVANHLIETSDIYAYEYYINEMAPGDAYISDPIFQAKLREFNECYEFASKPEPWDEHYDKYYEHEAEKGIEYGYQGHNKNNGREDVSDQHRFIVVSDLVGDRIDEGTFMDYGCAHGHYTVAMAKRYPRINFIGVDINTSNITTAKIWAEEEGLPNLRFYQGRIGIDGKLEGEAAQYIEPSTLDGLLAAEVVEHVGDYKRLVDGLSVYLKEDGAFFATTPYGPWEAMGYKKEWPWRAHVHHFERADLHEAFSHHPMFNVMVVACNESLGSYIWMFDKPKEPSRDIDYKRKITQLAPRQTVSLCMIAYNAEAEILNNLELSVPNVDEVIIAIDPKTTDNTQGIIHNFMKNKWPERPCKVIVGLDAIKEGFDVDTVTMKAPREAARDYILKVDAAFDAQYKDWAREPWKNIEKTLSSDVAKETMESANAQRAVEAVQNSLLEEGQEGVRNQILSMPIGRELAEEADVITTKSKTTETFTKNASKIKTLDTNIVANKLGREVESNLVDDKGRLLRTTSETVTKSGAKTSKEKVKSFGDLIAQAAEGEPTTNKEWITASLNLSRMGRRNPRAAKVLDHMMTELKDSLPVDFSEASFRWRQWNQVLEGKEKTIGNVVDPIKLLSEYGKDALRYYLMRYAPSFEDGEITYERFHEVYNADLANGLGNLTSRVLKMSESYFGNEDIRSKHLAIWSDDFQKYESNYSKL